MKISLRKEKQFSLPVLDFFNDVCIERFAMYPEKWKTVIVGSSASTYIPPFGYWPSNSYTITQQSGGGLTGLQAILKSGSCPEKVFIESDFLYRPDRKNISDDPFFMVNMKSKRYLPVLQREFSPIAFFLSLFYQSIKFNIKPNEDDVWINKNKKIGDRAKNYLVGVKIISDKKISDKISEIRKIVERLKNDGSEVVFFSLPLHPVLSENAIYKKPNDYFRNEFSDFPWIVFSPEEYLTEDGIHPLPEAGYRIYNVLLKVNLVNK